MSEDSAAKRRANQTVINLLLSLAATLGIVIVTILAVPRDDSNRIQPVDYRAAVAQAESASGLDIIAPELPQGWWSNRAKWRSATADGVQYFESGFVGPKNQYIRVIQAFEVNPTWVALAAKDFKPNSDATSANPKWTKWISTDEESVDPFLWTIEYQGNFVSLNGGYEEDMAKFATVIELELNQ
jgi:hypothetical protein